MKHQREEQRCFQADGLQKIGQISENCKKNSLNRLKNFNETHFPPIHENPVRLYHLIKKIICPIFGRSSWYSLN
jgi:hypothetical protein